MHLDRANRNFFLVSCENAWIIGIASYLLDFRLPQHVHVSDEIQLLVERQIAHQFILPDLDLGM